MLNSQVSGVAIQQRLRYSQSLKPCELQKPVPNHQSSFCWIFLPLLTLSIIRSSCPPSHRWASLGFHFAGLNPISLVGLSGWPGEGRYPKYINWSLGFLRVQFLDPSSSPHTLHHWVQSYRHMASPTITTLMTHSSISFFNWMIWLVEWSSHLYPECWITVNLQTTTENSSLSTLLNFILNFQKKNIYISLYLFLPSLACTYLNNAWDLLLRALPLSVCLFKMNRFVYSPIVSRFG